MNGLTTAVVVACLLSGCAESRPEVVAMPAGDEDFTHSRPPAGDVIILVSEPDDAGMEALKRGRLEILDGCLGASGSVIVWPHGTEVVENEPLTITVPSYGTFAFGDRVRVGGGYVLEHSSDDIEPGDYRAAGATVPADCAKHDIFVAD